MIWARQFLGELKKELKNHPDCEIILMDYEAYVYDLAEDLMDKEITYELLVTKIGSPKELAKRWREESGVTENRTKWIFIVANILLFTSGIFVTVGYHIFHWEWIEQLWNSMTTASSIILIVYTLFWALLGYEIGKEFGENGKRLLKKTFAISIIPNVILMFLVVFEIIPLKWFAPYLTIPFVIGSILLTALFYPISLLGYKWGRKVSV